jgi:hypothetical protein
MIAFGPHVLALIDFLGQASELAKWAFVPGTRQQMAEWIPAVRNSMGRVVFWREQFKERFQQFQAERDKFAEQFAAGQPAELRRQFDEYRKTSRHAAHFSDTLIFYSPLQNEHRYWQMTNVAGMIVACGTLMLAALATRTVFRGAIEVGVLSHFPTGDPYGPALAKAHYLEAKIADYPRIIVGPTLLKYLDAALKNPNTGGPAQANRTIAEFCKGRITQDSDGCWIVDYLNNEFAGDAVDRSVSRAAQAQAYTFVQAEHDRFTKLGDDKLARQLAKRYERLLAYFRSRGVT